MDLILTHPVRQLCVLLGLVGWTRIERLNVGHERIWHLVLVDEPGRRLEQSRQMPRRLRLLYI